MRSFPSLLALPALLTLLALLALPALGHAAAPAPAIAPLDPPPDDLRSKALAKEAKADGWHMTLNVGATGGGNRTDDVLGTSDGSTVALGALLDGSAERIAGRTEWLNTLKVSHAQTQTPQLPRFVKSLDTLDVASVLLFRRAPDSWVGPYCRVRAATAVFPGYLVQAADTTVRRTTRAGAVSDVKVKARTDILLTDWLEPLVVAESIGLFANPTDDKALSVKVRAGATIQHIVVAGGYAAGDDAKTPELELTQLRGANQAGADVEVAVLGLLGEGIGWRAKALLFQPLYSSSTDARALRLNAELSAGLSMKAAGGWSLEYQVAAKKVPLLLDKWQVQHGLVVALSFKL